MADRTWTKLGLRWIPEDLRDEIGAVLDRFPWGADLADLSYTAAEAVKAAVAGLGFRPIGVSRVGESPVLAPYGLIGFEVRHRDGVDRFFYLDRGTELVPIARDEEKA